VERQIALEGCRNFRDLGGYPAAGGRRVRWRRLFRSDALQRLAAADVRRLRDELGLGLVVDLRSSAELAAEGRGPLQDAGIPFHHVPLYDGETRARSDAPPAIDLADRYFLLAEIARERIAQVVALLAASPAPAVYHCAAGKDRTGVVSAVLLGALGVADELIVADYALSQRHLEEIVDRLLASPGYREMLEVLPPDTLHAEPETMERLLARVRERYGSMRGYLLAGGVGEPVLDRLAETLLEDV
jgi:protein-tyrosine phosphatase